MKRYSAETREWAIKQMMPPFNRAVIELSGATGITTVTLRTWRQSARQAGEFMPGNGKTGDRWSSADKFRAVLETASLNEIETSQYCRSKGIYPEQIRQWREACEQANGAPEPKLTAAQRNEAKAAQKRIRELERQLKRADAARAEAAALLNLRKKADANLGQGRGRLISSPDRDEAMQLINEAVRQGACRARACEQLGVNVRTVQRWRQSPHDGRTQTLREAPPNRLSEAERQAVLEAANRPAFASLTPHQIVPKLADEGVYLASESTFYRILKAAGQGQRRGRAKAPQRRPLTTHRANGPNQVWCWDITWMPTTVRGRYFYWYMMKDIYSRKLVMNEVWEQESAEHASELLHKGCLREGIAGRPLVLHSDNGSAMKGATMRAAMIDLGVEPSFSRPRVSNDNAFAEALFRTAKYCPLWPEQPFDTLEEARAWVQRFVQWYNEEHCHSGLKHVSPGQRHRGEADDLLARRRALYEDARLRNPARWSGAIRNWHLADAVYLNPERTHASVEMYKHAA
ncbi:IS3 family transposase [Paraburkholderia fungorum]